MNKKFTNQKVIYEKETSLQISAKGKNLGIDKFVFFVVDPFSLELFYNSIKTKKLGSAN